MDTRVANRRDEYVWTVQVAPESITPFIDQDTEKKSKLSVAQVLKPPFSPCRIGDGTPSATVVALSVNPPHKGPTPHASPEPTAPFFVRASLTSWMSSR